MRSEFITEITYSSADNPVFQLRLVEVLGCLGSSLHAFVVCWFCTQLMGLSMHCMMIIGQFAYSFLIRHTAAGIRISDLCICMHAYKFAILRCCVY